ncbi:MAG: M56 family metallopeptidase [Lachnospiraceae bacterium]|nr:M56 family metallopeptidase [Lachnospiraceae bacterium]
MTISVFSVIMSITCSSVILFAASFLVAHAKRVRWGLLLFIFILGFTRLAFPFEFWVAKEIRIWKVYPTLQLLAKSELFLGITTAELLLLIWMTGIVVLFFKFLKKLMNLREIIRSSIPVTEADPLHEIFEQAVLDLGYQGSMRIAVTEAFSTAVSVGIFRPIILISKEMTAFPKLELQGVVRHELTHYLRGDVCKIWALNIAQCIFWWNPVVYILKCRVIDMLELECDERACLGMDDEERLAYLEAIKHVLKSEEGRNIDFGLSYATSSQAGRFLKRRFLDVLYPVQKHSDGVTFFLAVISIVLFCLSYSFIVQPAGMPLTLVDDGDYISAYADVNEEIGSFLLALPDGTFFYISGMETKGTLTEQEIQNPPYNSLPIFDYIP